MDVKTGFFYVFALVMLFSAFRVITARNPVHAVLYLMLTFSQAAGIWLLLKAEFLGIALVLVYLGAVMVLFLFVVMMLDINIDRLRQGFWKHLPVAALVAVLIALQLALVLFQGRWQQMREAGPGIATVNNIEALGQLTFSKYVYPLQVAGAILLVAIIAAIALTLRARKDSKHQAVGDQVRVKRAERVRLVSMAAASDNRQDAAAVAKNAPAAGAADAKK